MKRKTVFLYITILFLVFACSTKNSVCGLEIAMGDRQKIPSTVKISEKFIIADTTVVSVSGKIYGDDLIGLDKFEPENLLPFANVVLTDIKTQQVFGETTDLEGAYNFTIPAGTYQLKIAFVSFNSIIIDSLKLGTGEIFNLSAQLGIGMDQEYFQIQTSKFDRKISPQAN
ncbi:carboxypeptidase-like regulatory domain-containing protein [uncultured Kordia sp.]|uniref:carboxypeptidase-like regulatory domain-containing protein n=1 Tax=uncultured Kordia sp. TaxID=507699 RepID=UPI0026261CD3|nr:carboxypeptidase-like regulatory domain-containing protein [uncultured Kordia sp.]